jgi:hypothetical protein
MFPETFQTYGQSRVCWYGLIWAKGPSIIKKSSNIWPIYIHFKCACNQNEALQLT